MSDTLNIFGTEYTNVAGIIATTPSETDLTYIRPQGTKNISANGTGIDVAAYASVDVAVPSSSPTIQSLSVTPSTSQQTFNASGVDGYKPVVVSAMPSGTAGTPTATKGTVSNHSVSVTPSVTNTTGYITGSTKTGTAVTVSASELVSGSDTLTDNGDYDVTNLASVTVNVSGGGGGSLTIGTKTATLSSASSSISFTGLSGNPTSFVVTSSADQTTGGTKVVSVAYDGTNLFGMDITTQMENDTGFTKSYSSGTLTITATTAAFQANEYKLVYTYGGSSSDIHTADVQVGSGATSITFTGLSGRPAYFSCVFKSSFSTSSGYQRVIDVVNDGTNTYGHEMDSSAHYSSAHWSYSYSGSSLTITSNGTNQGGYFHQPGYYQLTYAVDGGGGGGSASIDTKTTTSSNRPTSLSFTSMLGQPQAFFLRCTSSMSRSSNSTYYYVATMRYNGTNTTGNCWRMSNGNWTNITSGYSFTYSGTTLTLSSSGTTTTSPGCFYPGNYELVYIY